MTKILKDDIDSILKNSPELKEILAIFNETIETYIEATEAMNMGSNAYTTVNTTSSIDIEVINASTTSHDLRKPA